MLRAWSCKCVTHSLLYVFCTAIVAFTLFQRLIHDGISDVTLHDAGIVVSKVFGIGLGSVGLAALVCLTSAFLLKQADPVLRHYPSYEISIVLLSAYLSYVAADLAGLSGIVALFFSGVLMSHYHLYNIAEESATALRHLLTTASFLAENFIFIYLGMSVVAYSGYFTWDWRFIFANLVACLIGRMLNAFPMCMLANVGRKDKIPWSYMVVIWFAGLRGSIAFALALNVWTPDSTHSSVIQSTTLFTVMFTTLVCMCVLKAMDKRLGSDEHHCLLSRVQVFGMGTSPLLRHFGLTSNEAELDDLDEYVPETSAPICMIKRRFAHFSTTTKCVCRDGATERLLSDDEDDGDYNAFRRNEVSATDRSASRRRQRSDIHNMWHRLDNEFLKPIFGGHTTVADHTSGVELRGVKNRNNKGASSSHHPHRSGSAAAAASPQVSLAEIARNHDASHDIA